MICSRRRNQWRIRSVHQALKEPFNIQIYRVLVKRKTDVEIAFNLLRNPRKHMSLPSSPTTGPSSTHGPTQLPTTYTYLRPRSQWPFRITLSTLQNYRTHLLCLSDLWSLWAAPVRDRTGPGRGMPGPDMSAGTRSWDRSGPPQEHGNGG